MFTGTKYSFNTTDAVANNKVANINYCEFNGKFLLGNVLNFANINYCTINGSFIAAGHVYATRCEINNIDLSIIDADSELVFTNCTVNGIALTVDMLKAMQTASVLENVEITANGNQIIAKLNNGIDSAEKLQDAVEAGGEVTLSGDITASAPIVLDNDTAVINLNGNKINNCSIFDAAFVEQFDLQVTEVIVYEDGKKYSIEKTDGGVVRNMYVATAEEIFGAAANNPYGFNIKLDNDIDLGSGGGLVIS